MENDKNQALIKPEHSIEVLNALKSTLNNSNDVDIDINDYLINQLKLNEDDLLGKNKQLIQKNFIHLICRVINDLNIINERLNKYKRERNELDKEKSNEAEYRRRKLEYFAKLNKSAQTDILLFLTDKLTTYLKDKTYDTLNREYNGDKVSVMYDNQRYLFAQYSDYCTDILIYELIYGIILISTMRGVQQCQNQRNM